MAPRKFFRNLFLTLFILTILPLTPALAHSAAEGTLKEHVIKFYLDPALVSDPDLARAALSKYVQDMNVILAKNTNRRLLFDPQTGLILTTSQPHTNSARPPLPTSGFEIWVHAVYTDKALSYGGYAGIDSSGAGVLAGLHWTRLYDPDQLSPNQVLDYSIQLNNMLHELAHVFGAGIGEYYNLATIQDTTGSEPLLNINLNDPADPYWNDKTDFLTDPLLRLTRSASRQEYLATVRYSALTATILNGEYRNGIPSLNQFTVQVLDQNGQPVPAANVKVWNVQGGAPYPSQLLFDVLTDENGQVTLPWGGSSSPHSSYNFLRLIKAYKDGVPISQPRYLSIFDADHARLVLGQTEWRISLAPIVTAPAAPEIKTEIFYSLPTQEGITIESSQTSGRGGATQRATQTFGLGDDRANRQMRAILSFDTSSLPEQAVITRVTLKIRRQGIVGNNPFATLKNIAVDIRQDAFSTSPSLQAADFQAPASLSAAGVIANTPEPGNWYFASLKEQAFSFVNKAGLTQFRLRFQREDNGNSQTDALKFFSSNAAAEDRPILIVEYYLP